MVADQEYLDRELLDVNFDIQPDRIKVNSEHTSYCNEERYVVEYSKKDLLGLCDKIYRLATEHDITVSRKAAYKKFIKEHWNEYLQEVEHYNNLFDELIVAFEKVQERGLHNGTSDDVVLSEATNIRNKYGEIYYRSSVVSRINEIAHELEREYRDLQYNAEAISKVYL
ncbi:MAG: hypothetical protein ACOCQR_02110 [bacterium]